MTCYSCLIMMRDVAAAMEAVKRVPVITNEFQLSQRGNP